ncbi:MAG: hypothetical protein ABS92_01700 [Thiobacillus sp. SCN 63-374]|nr:MAG: hypothetical protein ABS92_01700 [Thiobacillus sp. SCN 63-374]
MSTNKKKSTKESYVSFDKVETAILRQLGWRERWLYLELKWKSDFETGQVGLGPYGTECLTHERLAELIVVPPSRGREADVIDGKEAARLLSRLEKVGLVGEIGRRKKNNGLLFALPLSPIDKVAARKARQDTAALEMLPANGSVQSTENDDGAWDCGDSSPPHPVMACSKSINTFFSNDGAGDTPAPGSVGSAPTPILPENPTPGALSLARIRGRLEDSWFVYVDTAESERFYASWIRQGFSESEFEEAVEQVERSDSLTPAAVDRVLHQRRVQKAKPRPGRGRVAL